MEVTCEKVKAGAAIPSKKYADDGCFDITSAESVVIQSGTRKIVDSGLVIQIPKGFFLRILPRSGLSLRGLDIGAGVVDCGYLGSIGILLINNSPENFVVNTGDRVAQVALVKVENVVFKEASTGLRPKSERGTGGWGSTGALTGLFI